MVFKYNASQNIPMKGISPVIATILLIAITVSVVVLVNVWFPGLIGSQQETIESSSSDFTQCASSNLEVVQARYLASGSPSIINVTVGSSGSQNLKNVTIVVVGGGASTTSIKYYNQTNDDLVPGLSFAVSLNTTGGASLPPEIVTVSGFCGTSYVVSDDCRAGEACMKPI